MFALFSNLPLIDKKITANATKEKEKKIMFIETVTKKPVTVITKNATPYSVEGNSGITYRIVVLMENDVEKLKCVNKDVFDAIIPGKDYILSGGFNVSNGRVSEWKVSGIGKTL